MRKLGPYFVMTRFKKAIAFVVFASLFASIAFAVDAEKSDEKVDSATAPSVADSGKTESLEAVSSSEAKEEEASKAPAEPIKSEVSDENAANENFSVQILDAEIQPKELLVLPGTTVVWVNKSRKAARVQFTSKAVSTTCKAPRGFGIGEKGIYVSESIASGGVASLCFLEPDEYRYEISFPVVDSDSAEQKAPETALSGLVRVGE